MNPFHIIVNDNLSQKSGKKKCNYMVKTPYNFSSEEILVAPLTACDVFIEVKIWLYVFAMNLKQMED